MRPGPVSVQLATGFDGNSDLVMAARTDMRELARQTHESVALVTAVNDRVVCLEMIDSEQSLRCSFDRGRSVPARDGATTDEDFIQGDYADDRARAHA